MVSSRYLSGNCLKALAMLEIEVRRLPVGPAEGSLKMARKRPIHEQIAAHAYRLYFRDKVLNVLFGSGTERVLHLSPCPVLIVKSRAL